MLLVGLGLIVLAFALSVALCGATRVVAPRLGLVDRPGGRKAHRRPTPLGGGVAFWLTTILVLGLGALVAWLDGRTLPPDVARHLRGVQARGGELAWIMGL